MTIDVPAPGGGRSSGTAGPPPPTTLPCPACRRPVFDHQAACGWCGVPLEDEAADDLVPPGVERLQALAVAVLLVGLVVLAVVCRPLR